MALKEGSSGHVRSEKVVQFVAALRNRGPMACDPDYGQTEVTWEELDALRPEVRDTLGAPVLRADLLDLEQLVQDQVAEEGSEELAGTYSYWSSASGVMELRRFGWQRYSRLSSAAYPMIVEVKLRSFGS